MGPVLREYLMGEAMHALGIPTTRALAAVRTGELIVRERTLPGAVLTRVAASHIRVGTFEYFASRGDYDRVRSLADYVIARHDPHLAARPDRYLALLAAVAERQAALVAQWMLVGFIHGVMNTDNMAVSGETIDYGPCAFMEAFNPKAVFSSIDSGGRYAYRNQPAIAQWNLTRFAETLLPFIEGGVEERAVAAATEVLQAFALRYEAHWLAGVRAKLGLHGEDEGDASLAADWLALLETQAVDFTLAWRRLADAADGRAEGLHAPVHGSRRAGRLARAVAPAFSAAPGRGNGTGRRHAPREPDVHPAESPGRRGPDGGIGPGGHGPVRAATGRDRAAVRRARWAGGLRDAGPGGCHGGVQDFLRDIAGGLRAKGQGRAQLPPAPNYHRQSVTTTDSPIRLCR